MQTTSRFIAPSAAQVAATLERGARIAAPVICWAIAAVLTAAQIAYQLGYAIGQAVHLRNDQLAAVARRLATGERQARPTHAVPVLSPIAHAAHAASQAPIAPQAPVVTPPAPMAHPLAALRDELSALTVTELRSITGMRRKTRKHDLVALALAMA